MAAGIADDGATIYALATPPGVGGIAVVRVSGPDADAVLAQLTRGALPAPRHAALRRIRDASGALIDEALVLRFEGGASYTGEPMAELHCHGGRAVVAALLAALGAIAGCRQAEPGEFTRRALLSGRLDLVDVEALGDLLSAETERQHRLAAAALGGALHRRVEGWRDAVLDAVALVEVTIDWADEEVPQDVSAEVAARLDPVIAQIVTEHAAVHGLERLREGFEVAVVGAPNCGKSSLINYLAAREMAITSPVPGTTRDVIELRYDLRGLPVTFLDMAGLRETTDPVERIGVGRAIDRARDADLRLHVEAADARADAICAGLRVTGDLAVWSKADLGRGPGDHLISTVTGEGVGELLGTIHDRLAARIPRDAVASHARHRAVLGEALAALSRAREALGHDAPEIVAEDLRLALESLGRLVGRVGVEDMLDRVFANFCLGK